MQQFDEALKAAGITTELLQWTSSYCYEHIPKRLLKKEMTQEELSALQEKFRVQMMVRGDSEVCPRCECDRETNVLAQEMSTAYHREKEEEKLVIFERQSVFQDNTLREATFATYKLDASEHEARVNKQAVLRVLEEYKRGQQINLWLTGNVGVGKSHLSVSLLKELNGLDVSCCFVDVDEMFRLITDSMFNNKDSIYTEKYFIDLAVNVDFLVLDDIGAETGNVNTQKEASDFKGRVLRAIVNGRQNKSTIFTTNLSYKQILQIYDAKLADRMFKYRQIIKFTETVSFRSRDITF